MPERERESIKEGKYRRVHEGTLLFLQQPLASACINPPVEAAKIPAGACYQKLHSRFELNREVT